MDTRTDYVLRLADACLVHGQRLAEWCGHAPVLEEDIALANIALDHIGQARALLTLAGQLEGRGRDEDQLAFLRAERDYRNVTMIELPNGDFARTVLRGFLWASFMKVLCSALVSSNHPQLAAIAAKSLKEVRYHQRHLGDWVVRLGDGSDESRRRISEALVLLWPYVAEWFDDDAIDHQAAAGGLGPAWGELKAAWRGEVEPVLAEATLVPPGDTPFRSTGKQGRHSEHMGFLLAEMQSLQRAFPGGGVVKTPLAVPVLDAARAWQVLGEVLDPEVPVLSVVELGIVREVSVDGDTVDVTLTPTYSGCPATEAIAGAVVQALRESGAHDVRVHTRLAPAWTTDWIAPAAAEKLRRYGIAPPHLVSDAQPMRFHPRDIACPRCASQRTRQLSAFGSTACKSLYRCLDCLEPFEYFKPI